MKKKVAEAETVMRSKGATIGNIVGAQVPVSQTEDDNTILRTWHPDGPNGQVEKKEGILAHHEVMLRLDMIDLERGEPCHSSLRRGRLRFDLFRGEDCWTPWILPHERRTRP